MRPESIHELAKRAGEVVAGEFDGKLRDVPLARIGEAIGELIAGVFANPEIWNRVWDM